VGHLFRGVNDFTEVGNQIRVRLEALNVERGFIDFARV
jgi:hypothetical protein